MAMPKPARPRPMTIVAQGAYSCTVDEIGRSAMPTMPKTATKPRLTASGDGDGPQDRLAPAGHPVALPAEEERHVGRQHGEAARVDGGDHAGREREGERGVDHGPTPRCSCDQGAEPSASMAPAWICTISPSAEMNIVEGIGGDAGGAGDVAHDVAGPVVADSGLVDDAGRVLGPVDDGQAEEAGPCPRAPATPLEDRASRPCTAGTTSAKKFTTTGVPSTRSRMVPVVPSTSVNSMSSGSPVGRPRRRGAASDGWRCLRWSTGPVDGAPS